MPSTSLRGLTGTGRSSSIRQGGSLDRSTARRISRKRAALLGRAAADTTCGVRSMCKVADEMRLVW
jgi:hypothetical protein